MTRPGGFVAGDVLTATDMNALPAGLISYSEVTANQTGISGETDLTSLTATWTAVSSRRYRITGYTRMRVDTSPSAATAASVLITDASNVVKQVAYGPVAAAGTSEPAGHSLSTMVIAVSVETGLSGSTTRKLRGGTTSDPVSLLASSTMPAFILVEDIGAA